ncbi:MAG TPA: PRC-barrel domain-containing protein [Azospirillaceae bacterium]|nr:PRC-barrel domain-containing protein [Azospirillaceae bacterium]
MRLLTSAAPVALAVALALSAPASAQQGQNLSDTKTQNDTPVSDQHHGPTGDRLAKPADPNKPVTGPTQAASEPGDTAAVNAKPVTDDVKSQADEIKNTSGQRTPADADDGNEGDDSTARKRPGHQSNAATGDSATASGNTGSVSDPETQKPAASYRDALGPSGAGAPGKGNIDAADLKDFTVHLSDKEGFGKVARVLVNLETGQLQAVEVSTGGLLGVGDKRFAVPWNQVAGINTGAKELRVAAKQADLRPQDEAFTARQ